MNIQQIYNDAVDGEIDALTAYIQLDAIEKEAKRFKEQIQEMAVSEADKYGAKTFQFNGYEIQRRAAAGRWKFDHISDWQGKQFELKEIEEKHKQAFKMAEKGDTYITEGGEVVEPAQYTPGKETIALKPLKP